MIELTDTFFIAWNSRYLGELGAATISGEFSALNRAERSGRFAIQVITCQKAMRSVDGIQGLVDILPTILLTITDFVQDFGNPHQR
jgi:hypothetical protein